MRILAIVAHPDDAELLCAGTLALCAQRGDEIFIAIATNGNVGTGDKSITREEIARIRHQEAKNSCAVIGATLIWMDFDDEWLFNNEESRRRFIDAIREARPDVMLIHDLNDYHPDHRIAGEIARDSRIPASVPLVKTQFKECAIPTVFLMDTLLGTNFEPEFYIDITDVIDVKEKMVLAHDSQAAWLKHIYGTEITENMYVQSRMRGAQAATKYGEGFKLLHDWPYTGDRKLLP